MIVYISVTIMIILEIAVLCINSFKVKMFLTEFYYIIFGLVQSLTIFSHTMKVLLDI